MTKAHCVTSLLRIAYRVEGPTDGRPVLLLHGWPDDPRAWERVSPALNAAGFRTYAPWLRGFGETRFLSDATPRSGEMVAMAQDAIDFADALGLRRFVVVGHDWGARIAYLLASVFPERVERIACISVGWQPGELPTPDLEQSQAFWYQWFLSTDRGAEAIRKDGKAFARRQWETWSPTGWFDPADFEATAKSFENPDWAAITIHSYRVRWGEAEPDPRFAELERQRLAAKAIAVPTLMIQGGADRCVLPRSSEGKERFFTRGYVRKLLSDTGHFPPREAPDETANLVAGFLSANP
jgi:pimeloyl-ACP methyl ester carboxylesterase